MPNRAIGDQHQWGSVEQASETPWPAPSTAAAMAGQEPYGQQTPSAGHAGRDIPGGGDGKPAQLAFPELMPCDLLHNHWPITPWCALAWIWADVGSLVVGATQTTPVEWWRAMLWILQSERSKASQALCDPSQNQTKVTPFLNLSDGLAGFCAIAHSRVQSLPSYRTVPGGRAA
jgi:hypothetical protein